MQAVSNTSHSVLILLGLYETADIIHGNRLFSKEISVMDHAKQRQAYYEICFNNDVL